MGESRARVRRSIAVLAAAPKIAKSSGTELYSLSVTGVNIGGVYCKCEGVLVVFFVAVVNV